MNLAAQEHDRLTVALTNEQIHRISALALDALAEVKIRTTKHTMDAAFVSFVSIDNPSRVEDYVVFTDGSVQKGAS